MSRATLTAAVALASYALFNIVFSLVAVIVWRAMRATVTAASSTARARMLIELRAMPAVAATAVTALAVVPAFAIFEPAKASEGAGPVLVALAAIAILQIAASTTIAIATTWRTYGATRRWLRSSSPLDVNPPAGVPAYVIDSLAPIVALVGVFKPKLIAARSVVDACSVNELTAIVAHERGHLHARDNLKRWLMACAPDALRWTAVHREITAAWHDAAEDAADDAATRGDAEARVDLAALIVKIARLAPASGWRAVNVSPFVDPTGLHRRVRRLVAAASSAPRPEHAAFWRPLAMTIAVAAAAIALQPAVLERFYLATEALIRFGR